jgi:outer membrane murein-binding lipoprotein Lpp
MKTAVMLAAVVASVLALAGCGGDDTQAVTTTETQAATTTTEATTTEATTEATTTEETAPTDTTAAAPKPQTIAIVVDQGRPRGGIQRPKIDKGQEIVLVIRSDAGEEVHVHGYDIERELTPGKTLRIPITASIPGRFEVELHHPDVLLAVLEVQP